MMRLLRGLPTRVVLAVACAVALTVLAQLAPGRAWVERQVSPLRDRSVGSSFALLQLAFEAGGLDARSLRTRFGQYDDLVIAVYDQQGKLSARSRDSEPVPSRLATDMMREAEARGHGFVYLTQPVLGGDVAAVSAVHREGRLYFLAMFDRYTGRHVAVARSRVLWVGLLTLVLCGLGFGGLFAYTMRRRLRALQRVARRMAQGDLSSRIQVTGTSEVTALARDFNRMADVLASTIEGLSREQAARRRLFADLTHELRTPLTNVLGYVESLSMEEVDREPATRQRYVRVVEQQARALSTLIEDVRTLSRLECEGLTLDRLRLDLSEVVAREVEALEVRAREQNVTLVCELAPETELEGDRERLAQVVRNLLDNALRYVDAGGQIAVQVQARPGIVELSVADDGVGILPEHLAHLGERFYRADPSRSRATGGRGLGLAIARGIVEAHGGTLHISSRPGEGTCVQVQLSEVFDAPLH